MYKELLHYVAMLVIVIGGFLLLYLSFLWYSQNNIIMGVGMMIMGLVALSNFYLHLVKMKRKR